MFLEIILFLKLKVSFIFTIIDNIYHHVEDKNKLESFSWLTLENMYTFMITFPHRKNCIGKQSNS